MNIPEVPDGDSSKMESWGTEADHDLKKREMVKKEGEEEI